MAVEIVTGVYNLRINKTSGTMTSWFTQTGQGTRMILAKVGASAQLLNLYVGPNEWNFVAIKWQYVGSTLPVHYILIVRATQPM